MMSKEEKKRVIAEWLGPKPTSHPRGLGRMVSGWVVFWDEFNIGGDGKPYLIGWQPRDFFTDEAANALVLEKLASASGFSITLQIDPSGYSMVDGLGLPAIFNHDRKTAICEAALKLIEAHRVEIGD